MWLIKLLFGSFAIQNEEELTEGKGYSWLSMLWVPILLAILLLLMFT
jgi:hypothetical protein